MKLLALITLSLLTTHCGAVDTLKNRSEGKAPKKTAPLTPDTKVKTQPKGFFLSIETYPDCQAIQDTVYEQRQEMYKNNYARDYHYAENGMNGRSVDSVMDSAPVAMEDSAESTTENLETFTNNQEAGIDEADYVKIGNKQIFVLGNNKVRVSDRMSLSHIGDIDMSDLSNTFAFSPNDQFVLVGVKNTTPSNHYRNGFSPYFHADYRSNQETVVRVYTSEAGKLPTLSKEYKFQGDYVDSRFTQGRLVLVMRGIFDFKEDAITSEEIEIQSKTVKSYKPTIRKLEISPNPIKEEKGSIAGVPCNKIVKQQIKDNNFNMTKVASIDVKNLAAPDVAATLGGGEQIYMNRRSLYVTKHGVSWTPWHNDDASSSQWNTYTDKLTIIKADIHPETGAVGFVASGMVLGSPKDQYAFKEYSESNALAVATTTHLPLPDDLDSKTDFNKMQQPWQQDSTDQRGRNHLWVLTQDKHNLKLAKVEKNFGEPGEDIRSVRFSNDHAYIVTFKKTDPLYSFDMANPTEFEMIGKLKIPGFSMYMHPAGDKLIGVGFDAAEQGDFALYQGIQVSLFDVSDPENVVRTDNKIHGQRGSNSEVTGDPHAFFYSEEDNIFALPVTELEGLETSNSWSTANQLKFSGAVVYSIEGDKLSERARLTHSEMITSSCLSSLSNRQWWQTTTRSADINRIYKVDGHILTLSRFGIKQYSLENLETPTIKSIYPNPEDCIRSTGG